MVIIANLCCFFTNRNNYTLGRWIYIPCLTSFRPFVFKKILAGRGYWVFGGDSAGFLDPDDLTRASIQFRGADWGLALYRLLSMMYFSSALITLSQAGFGTPYAGFTLNDWYEVYITLF